VTDTEQAGDKNARRRTRKIITERIQAVMRSVGYVKKDVALRTHRGVSHDAVAAALRGEMVKAGIVLAVSTLDYKVSDTAPSQSGSVGVRFILDAEYTLMCADDPNDKVTSRIIASGDDYGDKAPGKALSYGTKMFLLKTFMLETGENDEGRFEADLAAAAAEPVTTAQLMELAALIDETHSDTAQFVEFVSGRASRAGFSPFTSLQAMPQGMMDDAVGALKAKLVRNAATSTPPHVRSEKVEDPPPHVEAERYETHAPEAAGAGHSIPGAAGSGRARLEMPGSELLGKGLS